ncbi:MAG: uracil-DNA glycosylase family protein [Bacteriovoracaceae bacterium]
MKELLTHHKKLRACRECPNMCGTPVHGETTPSKILLIGQAPGPHEADRGKPFAYTAGKTLFKWLNEATDLEEEELRSLIYFAAVARCFPGKHPSGQGDREPNKNEIENCRKYLEREVELLKPDIIIPVGKLAIREVLALPKSFSLEDVIGKRFYQTYHGHPSVFIPLPHPSGISRWHKIAPGKNLLEEALALLRKELGLKLVRKFARVTG